MSAIAAAAIPPASPRLDPAIARAARRSVLALSLLAAPVVLAGCSNRERFAPPCPSLALLKDAADVTRFAPGPGRDVRDIVLDGRITAVPASCKHGDGATVEATLSVTLEITRGPAAPSRTIDVSYFIAVTREGQVLDEQDYTLRVNFQPNIDKRRVTGNDVKLLIPITREMSAAAYQIYVGFRLTPDELAFNRARGPR
jgi:hypothetical protein